MVKVKAGGFESKICGFMPGSVTVTEMCGLGKPRTFSEPQILFL